jgi:hypothetical protein
MAWDICPGEYAARYIDEQPVVITEALAFGQAVHHALEAHFNAEDGERAFRQFWRVEQQAVEGGVNPQLTSMGLHLLEQVFELGLKGVPERGFSLDTNAELGAPTVGAIDLSDDDGQVLYDFKTTMGKWSQTRAQTEIWQPVVYSWSHWERTDVLPDFEYIVLDRVRGTVRRFRRDRWSPDDWALQLNEARRRMLYVATCVRADLYACHGKHGYCPECGERWAHDHVCDLSAAVRRIRL